MTTLIVTDDGQGKLGPLTDLRPAFDVRSGARTNLERIETELELRAAALTTPDELVDLARETHDRPVDEIPGADDALVVNGRCALLPVDAVKALGVGEALVERASGHIVAVRLAEDDLLPFLQSNTLPRTVSTREIDADCALHHPEDVIRLRDEALSRDLRALLARAGKTEALPEGAVRIGEQTISVDPSANVAPGVVLDASQGPIVVEPDAVIRPGAILCGPMFVGAGSTVLDQALIKPNTAIGPVCKVAGEVGGTIFQGFANKAHDGHLGDAWIGEWANLGAGTTNSNLLNTYGDVPIRTAINEPRRRSGLQFLGCIVGDHVKTAICTRIMTGSVFGTGAMLACSAPAPTTVGAFGWVTDEGAQVFRPDKFKEVMRLVLARRGVTPSDAYESRIAELASRALEHPRVGR